jgi:hypothetical protein
VPKEAQLCYCCRCSTLVVQPAAVMCVTRIACKAIQQKNPLNYSELTWQLNCKLCLGAYTCDTALLHLLHYCQLVLWLLQRVRCCSRHSKLQN